MIRDIAPIGLRLPPELKERIRNAASTKPKPSMNQEIVDRLTASFHAPTDLSAVPTADLVRELINRNMPGRITIDIFQPGNTEPEKN